LKSLKNADIKGKRVLMRVDFNVPRDKEGNIQDDTKIRAALPSIQYILNSGASLILMSHLGRPKGKKEEKFSLRKVGQRLSQLLGREVVMANDCIGAKVENVAMNLRPGEVFLLENIRFYMEEEKNDPDFAQKLASLGDLYVNDAFGTAHRAHASTVGVADFLPAYAGLLMEKEVTMLKKVLDNPESPRMAILGGAKVSDKLSLINNFLDKMDTILIGGGMANTFLRALGKNVGKSLHEEELLNEAKELLDKAKSKQVDIILPVDVVVANELSAEVKAETVLVDEMPDDRMILDIGPETIKIFEQAIAGANTIVWNGPLGVYEYKQFANGTKQIALAVANSNAVSVAGGGETVAAVHDTGVSNRITHISTGGGATLEFLEGIVLPGVAACEKELAGAAK